MAKDVNIKVKLNTQDAKKKLDDLAKERKKSEKEVKGRERKAKKKAKKKPKATEKRGKGGRANLASKIGKIEIIIAVLDGLFTSLKALTLSGQKSNNEKIKKLSNKVNGVNNTVEGFILQFAELQALIESLSAARRLARAGISATSITEIQKAFSRKRRLEAETSRRESTLNQSDYLELMKRTMGFGGN
jgi:hypothetical protein